MKNFLKNILKGKLFGHPIHVMLVHFPIAFFPMSAVLDLFANVWSNGTLSLFSFYSAAAGSAFGFFAIIFGVIDLIKISPEERYFNTALLHGGLNFLWIIIFAIIAGTNFKNYPEIAIAGKFKIIIEFLLVGGILFSNFLGGELVLKYGVGKKKM